MELGNIIFGHSRGQYEVPRTEFENVFIPFLESLGLGDRGYDNGTNDNNVAFDNDTFTIRPYYWGWDNEELENAANFVYKPTNFEIRWYKYPFRDSYMNQNLTIKEFTDIINKCKESITRREHE